MKEYRAVDHRTIASSRYIDKDELLKIVSQEEIFSLVFGFLPEEMQYCVSPFREDNTPNCFFSYSPGTTKLTFTDFANSGIYGRIRLSNLDCFAAVQVFFRIPSFLKTLEFLWDHFVSEGNVQYPDKVVQPEVKTTSKKRKLNSLFVSPRNFNSTGDKDYWMRYGITKSQLRSDRVFPIDAFQANWSDGTSDSFLCYTPSYAFTEFKNGAKKIFITSKEGRSRFMTDCRPDDIGGLRNFRGSGKTLVIKKSYKDWRVVTNEGVQAIWLQSETSFPSLEVLLPLCKNFTRVVIFFDNDPAGIKGAQNFKDRISPHLSIPVSIAYLPTELLQYGITDPSDLYYKRSRRDLRNFLIERNMI